MISFSLALFLNNDLVWNHLCLIRVIVKKRDMKLRLNSLIIICIALIISGTYPVYAQSELVTLQAENDSSISQMVKSGNYIFKARMALPMQGGSKFLTTDYDLVVSSDTIKAWLPYFGRAYSAPIDPSGGGIKFTSTRFDYKVNDLKKGGWRVEIAPKDVRDVRKLTLNISESGYSSLQVISNRRQLISFNGKIVDR